MAGKRYLLTARAAADLREGAELIAQTLDTARRQHELAGGTGLFLYPVREHYIVYEPLGAQFIAIVSVIRQGRDLPAILQKWAAPIRHELMEIRAKVARGEMKAPRGLRASSRRRNVKK